MLSVCCYMIGFLVARNINTSFVVRAFGSSRIGRVHHLHQRAPSSILSTTGRSTSASSPSSVSLSSSMSSVGDFLRDSFQKATADQSSYKNVAIGNPAGDADSLISAIALAYLDSTSITAATPTLPIASIPWMDLSTQRPETKYLLRLAGVTDLTNTIVAMDDDKHRLPGMASVTLVDHNRAANWMMPPNKEWTVTKIVDHHIDEGHHLDSCPAGGGGTRMIAFEESTSQALVASTCTLLVEQLVRQYQPPKFFPASLSILLLGVILLDSVNLSPKAGKVTQRDIDAVQVLQERTVWNEWKPHLPDDLLLPVNDTSDMDDGPPLRICQDTLFASLNNQKFSSDFWNALSARQALRLDYKSFPIPHNSANKEFGVTSILQDVEEFWKKEGILSCIAQDYSDLEVFVCMYCCRRDSGTGDGGSLQRSMSIMCQSKEKVEALTRFLEEDETVQIQRISASEEVTVDDTTGFSYIHFRQSNVKASRKQVVPILLKFFDQTRGSQL